MGNYLSDEQIEKARDELAIVYAMPYTSMLVGPAWEQILADLKGGMQRADSAGDTERWLRDNRANPDIVARKDGVDINYSLKTEALRVTAQRSHATDFLGYHEDIIAARPKVDDLLEGRAIASLDVDELGAYVLRYYNEQIVARYKWHVISFLLRLESQHPLEFIYWEESPPAVYNPDDYWWRDSGRATGGNRNINGFPQTVSRDTRPLPRAKFKWTSGGKQFYVLYTIPPDADVWTVDKLSLSVQDVREALRELLRRQQRISGQQSAT